jgi:hypothetical protein
MNRSGIIQFVLFFIYVLVQVLVLRNLVLFNSAFCFLYIAFILLLPIELNSLALMVIGFVLGFTVDIFYNSMGLHALATVLIAYVRNYWLGTITPQGGYDANSSHNVSVKWAAMVFGLFPCRWFSCITLFCFLLKRQALLCSGIPCLKWLGVCCLLWHLLFCYSIYLLSAGGHE